MPPLEVAVSPVCQPPEEKSRMASGMVQMRSNCGPCVSQASHGPSAVAYGKPGNTTELLHRNMTLNQSCCAVLGTYLLVTSL